MARNRSAGQSYTCPNPCCGRRFSVPLKVVDLRLKKPQPYLACPHCLGEIVSDQRSQAVESFIDNTKENAPGVAKGLEKAEKTLAAQRGDCAYHLGYLSERSSREGIPEECMVCGQIVKCMLRSIKGQ